MTRSQNKRVVEERPQYKVNEVPEGPKEEDFYEKKGP